MVFDIHLMSADCMPWILERVDDTHASQSALSPVLKSGGDDEEAGMTDLS